jgi:hypothetical protein
MRYNGVFQVYTLNVDGSDVKVLTGAGTSGGPKQGALFL